MTVQDVPLSARAESAQRHESAGEHGFTGSEPTPVAEALTLQAVVELIFMMLILKLPILYLAGVCYWAIKAEPKPLEAARVTAPLDPGPWAPFRRRPRRPTSHGGPRRREARIARAAHARPSP